MLNVRNNDESLKTFENTNLEYHRRSLFGGSTCHDYRGVKCNCNCEKLQDIQRKLDIAEVSSLNENISKEILDSSQNFHKIMVIKFDYDSEEYIRAFEKSIRKAPTLNYLMKQVSNMVPETCIYRKLMFDVLNDNLDLTFFKLQQLSMLNVSKSTSYNDLGMNFKNI